MDNVPAWVLGILAVVALVVVIVIGGFAPSIDKKSDDVVTEFNGIDYPGN